MSGFDNNLNINFSSQAKKAGKQNKELQNKENEKLNLNEQISKGTEQNQMTQRGSLANTNSNVVINQPTLTNPALNQSALNTTNIPKSSLNLDLKNTQNTQIQPAPNQSTFQGPKDIPSYHGIPNISLKSWVAEHDNKNFAGLDSAEKQLVTTLEGIKGFQRQNYEGGRENFGRNKNKNLLILSHIFSSIEQSSVHDTELLVNVSNFKKLGTNKNTESFTEGENKLPPPMPNELHKINMTDNIKYLHELFALPSEFPECLRLFAKDKVEINQRELNHFLTQRVKLAQEQLLGADNVLNKTISNFVPLLNQDNHSFLLPLVLLYYPLPLPQVKWDPDFVGRKKKKEKGESKTKIVASCNIYFMSKTQGRFLLKFELNDKDEFSFNIETSEENNSIVQDLETAISEVMLLLENPPLLSDLNVKLTEEIYKLTDIDEELSIVSSGPLRLEIVLAVYSVLIVLNKLSNEIDPSGIIEMES